MSPTRIVLQYRYQGRDALDYGLSTRPLYLLAAPIATLYLAFLFVSGTVQKDRDVLLLLTAAAAAASVLVILAIWARNRESRRGNFRLLANDRGVELDLGSTMVTSSWEGLQSARRRGAFVELRWPAPHPTIVIPRRAFANEAEEDALLALAASSGGSTAGDISVR